MSSAIHFIPSASQSAFLQLPPPILKAPLLLFTAYIVHLACKPPTPPANSAERAKYNVKGPVSLLGRGMANLYRYAYWVNAIGESAVLLSSIFASPLSDTMLSLLAGGDRASTNQIRFTPIWLGGWALVFAGSIIRFDCFRTLGRFHTFELGIKEDHQLITSGPYGVVRHPSYTACMMIAMGEVLSFLCSGTWFTACGGMSTLGGRAFAAIWTFWAIFVCALTVGRANKEDAVLKGHFGEKWEAYAKKTPYALIPFIY